MERAARMATALYRAATGFQGAVFRVALRASAPRSLFDAVADIFRVDAAELRGAASFTCRVAIAADEGRGEERTTTFMVDRIRSMRVGDRVLGDVEDEGQHLFFDLSWLAQMERLETEVEVEVEPFDDDEGAH